MSKKSGFTIIELVVTIAVIGILALIVGVSFAAVTKRAEESRLTSDLLGAKSELLKAKAEYGTFPATIDCDQANSKTNWCIELSDDIDFNYTKINSMAFHLTATKGDYSYSVNDGTAPAIATTTYGSSVGKSCPSGFIPVPGSGTYRTNDFCVMKYEAKADDNGDGIGDTTQNSGYDTWPNIPYTISASRKLVSSAAGYPVARVTQALAITFASSADFVYDCPSGCHLITEAEWLTIAQNVLSVPSNWSNNMIGGSNYIYSGHNDNVPAKALVADSNDNNNYIGTGQSSPSNQRRTLTLTNGEVIWDLAGNLMEWTTGQTDGLTAQQPGNLTAGFDYREWNAVTTIGTLPVNPFPSFGTVEARSWNAATNGIGQLYSSADDTALRVFIRGGRWSDNFYAGIFMLGLDGVPSNASNDAGLRVSR